MISHISREELLSYNHEKINFYLGIRIDRRDECIFWIEFLSLAILTYFLIFLDRIGDVGSFYSAFS
jgi:hypothetical protein